MQGPRMSLRIQKQAVSWAVVLAGVFCLMCLVCTPAMAKGTLTISSSSQVYETFKDPGLDDFRKSSKAEVNVDVLTSEEAIARLVHGFSDVAATAERIDSRLVRQGYVEFPICKDDFAVLTHVQTTVKNITHDQLQNIFSGAINNWNQLGGPDKPLVVIVPSESSAAYENFERLVMEGHSMSWDIMTSESTAVVDVIRRFPWSLTFVAQGATHGQLQGTKVMKINDMAPGDADYPYIQTYSIVTKGKPRGLVKDFIEYIQSDSVKADIKAMGMRPLNP